MGRNYNYSQSSCNTHSCTGQRTLACSCPRCREVRAAALPIPHVNIRTLSSPAGRWEPGFQIRAFRRAGTKFIGWHQAKGSGEAKTEAGKDNKEKSKEEGQDRSADGGGGEGGQHGGSRSAFREEGHAGSLLSRSQSSMRNFEVLSAALAWARR